MGKIRRYSELILLPSFEERFEYLKLGSKVGADTFGFDRWQNQAFYNSPEWKRVRDKVIIRDNGCDLGIVDREIGQHVIIHHMNPITVEDIRLGTNVLLNPEFLICVSHETHNAIHYGDADLLPKDFIPRSPNDTCPWKRQEDV